MLLSIVIPCYNYAQYLPRAVKSVMSQAGDCEVIIINDGSTDNSESVIQDLQKKYPHIQAIHQKNAGAAAARNTGIQAAQGDYLIFLDADDELLAGAIEGVAQKLIKDPSIEFLIAAYHSQSERGQVKVVMPKTLANNPEQNVVEYLLNKNISIANGASVIKRRVFNDFQYNEQRKAAEDLAVFARLLACYRCATLQQPILISHRHHDSLRHHAQHQYDAGSHIVDDVFDGLPDNLQQYRNAYRAQRLLSLSRTAYKNKHYAQSKAFYRQALKLNMKVLFKWTYLKFYVRSLVRSIFS